MSEDGQNPLKGEDAENDEPTRRMASVQLQAALEEYCITIDALQELLELLTDPVVQDFDETLKKHLPLLLRVSNSASPSEDEPDQLRTHLRELASVILGRELSEDDFERTVAGQIREGQGVQLSLSDNPWLDVQSLQTAVRRIQLAGRKADFLNRSLFLTLTSAAEWVVHRSVEAFYKHAPSAATSDEKMFSLDHLRSLGSIDEAENFLIAKRVEKIMRGDVDKWIEWFEKERDVGNTLGTRERLEVIEVFQRRHLLVHAGGRVDNIYLRKVDESLTTDLEIGTELPPTTAYLGRTLTLLELAFVRLNAGLWRKILKDDDRRAVAFNNIAYDKLTDERYDAAKLLSSLAMQDKHGGDDSKLVGQINYWLSYKLRGDFETVQNEVANASFDTNSLRYKVPWLALLDRHDEVFALLPSAISSGELGIGEIQQWLVFVWVRDDSRYGTFLARYPAGHGLVTDDPGLGTHEDVKDANKDD